MNNQSMSNLRAGLSVAALAVAAFASTATASAQANVARAKIPFAFENGSRHLPAGDYTLSMLNERVVDIRGATGSSFAMVQPQQKLNPATKGQLVFHRYGNHYMLREIWVEGSNTHLECSRTKLEKELELASNRTGSPGLEIASIDVLP